MEWINTRSLFLLTILIDMSLRSESTKYRIVGLLPLSGPHKVKGHAQWVGMKLAIDETLYNVNNVRGVTASFTYNDTGCDSTRETEILAHHLADLSSTSARLVVVGGGCDVKGRAPLRGIPQVTFEDKGLSPDALYPVSVRGEGDVHAYRTLAEIVAARPWPEVVLVSQDTTESQECRQTAQTQLEQKNVSISHHIQDNEDILISLKKTRLRIVVVCLDIKRASDTICEVSQQSEGRYIWLVPTDDATNTATRLRDACQQSLRSVVLLEPQETSLNSKVSHVFSHVVSSDATLSSASGLQKEAGYSYDATRVLLGSLRALGAVSESVGRADLGVRLGREIQERRWSGVTGLIEVDNKGRRRRRTYVYGFKGDTADLTRLISTDPRTGPTAVPSSLEDIMTTGYISSRTQLEGVSLPLFVIMCALSGLGVVYATVIIVFNIAKRTDRAIKMTSPNLNVFSLLACCGGYGAVVMVSLDTDRVTKETMEKLLQATSYVLVIGFSLLYGSVFAKSWRVFTIFRNLNANGKVTRDEHLLLGVLFMVLLDLAILLPWSIVDPIRCSKREIAEIYEASNLTDVTIEIDVCTSSKQGVWIAVIYVYKLLLLLIGFFFSWQTRHVTLPALRDAQMINISIGSVVGAGIVALPLLLVRSVGGSFSCAVGGLLIWLTITVDISLLFLPKMFLYKKNKSKKESGGESFRFQFSESMKRTQEALRKMVGCLCCGVVEGDKYAQEMLVTEIETLKRTIKDKDASIRDLTDRLYMGAEKFQEYLQNQSKHQDDVLTEMHNKYTKQRAARNATVPQENHEVQRNKSLDVQDLSRQSQVHNKDHMGASRTIRPTMQEPSSMSQRGPDQRRHDNQQRGKIYAIDTVEDRRTVIDVHNQRTNQHSTMMNSKREYSPSPNFDSAIDNTSPSSNNSEFSIAEPRWQQHLQYGVDSCKTFPSGDVTKECIDLDAMEKEAAGLVSSHAQYWTPTRNPRYSMEPARFVDSSEAHAMHLQHSVSQI